MIWRKKRRAKIEREWWSSFSPAPPTVYAKTGLSFSKKIYKSWFPERARDLFPRGKFGLQEEELANYKFWRAFTTWPAIPIYNAQPRVPQVRPSTRLSKFRFTHWWQVWKEEEIELDFFFFLPGLNPSLSLCWSTSKPWLSSFKGHNARARFLSSFALLKKNFSSQLWWALQRAIKKMV